MDPRPSGRSLGMVETRGFTAAVEAADAMTKSARVSIVRHEVVPGARVTILVRGELAEVEAARRVAKALGAIEHKVLSLDLRAFGGSGLTTDIPVPKARAEADIGRDIPPTYVPARNTILLSLLVVPLGLLGGIVLTGMVPYTELAVADPDR